MAYKWSEKKYHDGKTKCPHPGRKLRVGYDSGDYEDIVGRSSDSDWLWCEEERIKDPGYRMYVMWYRVKERVA